MKFLLIFLITFLSLDSIYTLDIKKEGLIPDYEPYSLKNSLLFLPYNPNIVIAGDHITDFATEIAKKLECGTIYGFTANPNDFKKLNYLENELGNIKSFFGALTQFGDGSEIFYASLPQEIEKKSPRYYFSGSFFRPIDQKKTCLYGSSYKIPTFNFSNFCTRKNLHTIHLIDLDCGGNELALLKSISNYLKKVIVVRTKTYHQQIRRELQKFPELHDFMTNQGYELLSHHIYNGVIGDALYVKSRYVNAVFRRKGM